MPKAERVIVNWDNAKKEWRICLKFGQEVIKRPVGNRRREASEKMLLAKAVQAVRREGFDIDQAQVEILSPSHLSWDRKISLPVR